MEYSAGPRVLIVGAGFSGLVAAWSLSKQGFKIEIIEKSDRVGGLLGTNVLSDRSGNRIGFAESAANGLLGSELADELFRDCGLSFAAVGGKSKRRYFWVENRVQRWPLSILESLRLFYGILEARRRPPTPGETVFSWGERVFGSAFASKILDVGLLGIFAASAKHLSAKLLTDRFFNPRALRRRSGKSKGTSAPVEGMGQLTDALETWLREHDVKFQMETDAAPFLKEAVSEGRPVVLATAASAAAALVADLESNISWPDAGISELRRDLQAVRMIPVVSVTIVRRGRPKHDGFGILFSQNEGNSVQRFPEGVLGVLRNSTIFDGRLSPELRETHYSETWILGGAEKGAGFIEKSDESLVAVVEEARAIALAEPESQIEAISVSRWPAGIPLYDLTLEDARDRLLRKFGSMILFGNYLGDLGLASILEQTRRLKARLEI